MKKGTKIAIAVAIVIMAIWFLYGEEISFKLKEIFNTKAVKNKDAEQTKDTPHTSQPAQTTINRNKLLKKGVKGLEVRELQKKLKDNPSVNLGNTGTGKNGIDGDFGVLTEKALMLVKGIKQITLNDYDKKPGNTGTGAGQISDNSGFETGFPAGWSKL